MEAIYSPMVTGPYALFSTLTFIISTMLIILIFSYLHNVALEKECVLVYLYKDVLINIILLNCMRLITLILCYSIDNGVRMDITQAKVVSSVIIYLVIWLLLLLNVINAVKCQISVSKVVDPPMPWGDDEHFGIRLIRLSCFVFTTAFVALTYALGVYSLLYYVLIQRDASEKVPTESTFIYFGFILFLVITGTITGLIAKFYEPVN